AHVSVSMIAAVVLYVIASVKPDSVAGGFASNGFGDLNPGKYGLMACLFTSISRSLSVSGSGISQRNSDGAATRCRTAAATMPATASASAGCRIRTTHRQRPSPPGFSAPGADNPCNASSRAVNLGAKPLPRPAKKRHAHSTTGIAYTG